METASYPRSVSRAHLDLAQLMAATAQGDHDAFAQLYTALCPLVQAKAAYVLRDRAQAEEVAQEVIAELWSKASHFRPDRGSAAGWTLAMAHRRAIDRLRHHQAAVPRDLLAAACYHHPAHDSVPEQVVRDLEQQEVRRHLADLTPRQRQSLELAFYYGYTYAEAAVLLDIPLGTYKSRVRDALRRLGHHLGQPTG